MDEQAAEVLRHKVKLAIVWHADYLDGFMWTVEKNGIGANGNGGKSGMLLIGI